MDFRSVAAGGSQRAEDLATLTVPQIVQRWPVKFWWFLSKGYQPHVWQSVFHGAESHDRLTRFRTSSQGDAVARP